MFLNTFLVLINICTTSDLIFKEMLDKVETGIDCKELKQSLKIAKIDDITDLEAKLIISIFFYCERMSQEYKIDTNDVYDLIKTNKDASQLLIIADKLVKFDVSIFLQQPFAEKYNLHSKAGILK